MTTFPLLAAVCAVLVGLTLADSSSPASSPSPSVQDADGKWPCVSECKWRLDGDYQSCHGCHVYATCSNFILFDDRPCPANLVWDDIAKRCEWYSHTCGGPYPTGKNVTVCEGHTKKISCPSPKKLHITSAVYGRQVPYAQLCPPPGSAKHPDLHCKLDVLDIVRKACEGDATCMLYADNCVMKKDPCKGTYKYLTVTYNCK